MTGKSVFKKAELISEGILSVDKRLKLPYFLSCSGSGPDAGEYSITIAFNGHRLKTPISRKSRNRFSLTTADGKHVVLDEGKPYIDEVKILPCGFHAPGQAFLDLNEGCIFDCAFCNAPGLKNMVKAGLNDEILRKAINAGSEGTVKSISITGGIVSNPGRTIEELIAVVDLIKRESNLPIGVEPYVEETEHIERLHSAGAEEIKINIQSFDEGIFRRICPQWDFRTTLNMIENACEVFGRGKVTSNLIFGLGENDENVLTGVETLATMGCVVNLRKIRVNEANKENLNKAIGDVQKPSAQRMIQLAENQKKIFLDNGLDPRTLKTMCSPCSCCDIAPFVDI